MAEAAQDLLEMELDPTSEIMALQMGPSHPATHQFTAKLVPARRPGPPQHHEFQPTVFHRQFSPLNKPVLTVWPGDSIHTTTVDAGCLDGRVPRAPGISQVCCMVRGSATLDAKPFRSPLTS